MLEIDDNDLNNTLVFDEKSLQLEPEGKNFDDSA